MAEKRTEDASRDSPVKEQASDSDHELGSDFIEGPEWKGNDGRNCVLPLLVKYKKGQGKKIVKAVKSIPCSWNFDAYWNFYTKRKQGQKMLDDIVKKYGCCVTACTDDEDFFVFEVTATSFEQESDFLYFVNDVLDNIYKCAKKSLSCDIFSVDHRIQVDTLKRVKYKEELHNAWIELAGEHDPDAVCVVCAVKEKVSVHDILRAIISEAKECYNNHEETVAVDFIWQKVLQMFGYLQEYNDKFPNVMIKPDEAKDVFVLKGPRDDLKAAADHLLELFRSAHSEVHEKVFSPACQFEILTYPEMCDYIDNSIPKLPIVWIPNNVTKKIHIFSKQPEQAKGTDKFIKGCIQERLYPLSKDHSLLNPGVRALEKLKREHNGKIVIHAFDAGLLVTTADDIFETVDAKIQEIIGNERGKESEDLGDIHILKGMEAAVTCHFFEEELLQIAIVCDCVTTRQPAKSTPEIIKLQCSKSQSNNDFKRLVGGLESKIRSLSQQEVSYEENQWEKVAKFLKENESKDVLLYCNPDVRPVVSILSRNYTDVKSIQHRLQVELNIIKPSGRMDRKPASESDSTEYSKASVSSRSVHGSSSMSGQLYPDLPSPAVNSETDIEFIIDGELLVKVYKGSITHVRVDAIVNAANDALVHAEGVARIIEEAAGNELTRESKKYIEQHSYLKVGEVCCTTAGRMSYKSVMHAVGPQWHMYTDKSECLRDLDTTILSVLLMADEKKYQKIAMPAISAGIFGVPTELCADMYVRAAVKYSKKRKTHTTFLKEFHIVDIDTEILQCVKTSWEKLRNDPQAIDPERAVENYFKIHGRHDSSHGWGSGHRGRHQSQQFSSTVGSTNYHSTPWSDSQNRIKVVYLGKVDELGHSVQIFKIGKEVVIKTYKASLANVYQIDAVVCGISSKGERGALAKIVLEAAGRKYEKSFDEKRWKFPLKPGDILKCDPGNLQVRCIIHVVIDRLQSTKESDIRSYRFVINHLLKEVNELKDIKIMAMPLLGSGGFEGSPADLDHCCSAFLQAVLEFYSDEAKPNITEIHIVNIDNKVCTGIQEALHKVSKANDSDNSCGSNGKEKIDKSSPEDQSRSRSKNNSGISHGNPGRHDTVSDPGSEFDDLAMSRAEVHGSASGVPNVGSDSKFGDQNNQILADRDSGPRGDRGDTSTCGPDKKVQKKGNLMIVTDKS